MREIAGAEAEKKPERFRLARQIGTLGMLETVATFAFGLLAFGFGDMVHDTPGVSTIVGVLAWLFSGHALIAEFERSRLARHAEDTQARFEKKVEQILNRWMATTYDLGNLPETLEDVAKRLIDGSVRSIKNGEFFESEDEYMEHMSSILELVAAETKDSKNGRVQLRALCSKKDWASLSVNRYWAANVRAVRAGVKICRVFVDTDRDGAKVAESQSRAGVKVWVIPEDKLNELSRRTHFVDDFGFVVIKSETLCEVLVHWGIGASAKAKVISSTAAVQEFDKLFDEAIHLADPVEQRFATRAPPDSPRNVPVTEGQDTFLAWVTDESYDDGKLVGLGLEGDRAPPCDGIVNVELGDEHCQFVVAHVSHDPRGGSVAYGLRRFASTR